MDNNIVCAALLMALGIWSAAARHLVRKKKKAAVRRREGSWTV